MCTQEKITPSERVRLWREAHKNDPEYRERRIMDYEYIPKEIREQGKEAIKRELEKKEWSRAVLEAIAAGAWILTIVLGTLFAIYMSSRKVQYEYTLDRQTGVAKSCKVSNGALVCTLSDGTTVRADSFKEIVEENE